MESQLPTDPLDTIRKEIDESDRQLVQILARRFDAVKRVGTIKHLEEGQPLLDTERERRVQASWVQDAEALGLSAPFARRVLKEILNHSRRLQEALIENRQGPGRRIRCGYQGQPGSYSGLAAAHLLAHRGAESGLAGYDTFQEVGKARLAGEVDYGLLPVENSIGGSIADVNRLICDHALYIVDEEIWQVEHVLAVPPGTQMADVRAIRSHPAALTQCETFLSSLEDVRREPWSDTATAAESLKEGPARERGDTAAICSEEAATLHGLDVIARSLADRECNETRFLLLARAPETPDPRLPCKTSMLFRVNHHEGALVRALNVFAEARVNLSRIESRPQPDTPWEYLFFVDVEGHIESPALAGALRSLRASCSHLRMLGCYPSRTRKQDGHLDLAPAPAAARPEPPSCVVELPRAVAAPPRPDRSGAHVRVGPVEFGEGRFVLISGPCAVESLVQITDAARMVRACGATMLRGGAFKPRTSPHAFLGLGAEGLVYLQEAGQQFGLPTVTEVLTIEDIPAVMAHADALQVGARNMHNFALLKELGKVNKPVILKRGMSATLKEFLLAAEYLLSGGNLQVILCERGIRTFETATRATLDLSAVPVLRRLTHLPIIVDPSHAAGDRELVVPLALAAAAAGADGLIVEAHPRPEEALCDKEQALSPDDLARMTAALRPIVAAQGRVW